MSAMEWRVISEIMRSRDFGTVMNMGLNKGHFRGDHEAGQVFDFIREHYTSPDTYRQFPTVRSIEKRWPSYKETSRIDVGQLATLIQELKKGVLDTDLHIAARQFNDLVDARPEDVIPLMQSLLAQIDYEHSTNAGFGLREVADRVQEAYEGALKGTLYGIPWPWDCLTQDTLGKNPGDFIVLYGRMKSMKTWLMMISAIEDYVKHRRRVLIWSREMDEKKMSLRAGALLAKADYQCLKRGSLPPKVHNKSMNILREMANNLARTKEEIVAGAKKDIPDLIFMCGRRAPKTLEALEGAVQAFNPDIVYMDSFYHMECDKTLNMKADHDKQRIMAEEIKQRALDWGIPIVGTTQANRAGDSTYGENMADIARSDAIAREADLILRILYKKGRDLYEDDYEAYWKSLEMGELDERKDAKRSAGPKLGPRPSRGPKPSQAPKVPQKIQDQFLTSRDPRATAVIGIALSGNREGTMEGFTIRVSPGVYGGGADVLEENVSHSSMKEQFGEEGKSSGNSRGKGPKRNELLVTAKIPSGGEESYGGGSAGSN